MVMNNQTPSRNMFRSLCVLSACVATLAAPWSSAIAGTADPSGTSAQWQAQKLKFDYSGFTTLYTCDGLEDKVRDILLAFGARKDMKVRATGCTDGMNRPSRFAWVSVEFSSLAPSTEPAAANAVKAGWTQVQIAPNRPSYMGAGECELVEQMHELLQKGFVLRNADYRTTCVPHQVSLADYHVTADVLKALPN